MQRSKPRGNPCKYASYLAIQGFGNRARRWPLELLELSMRVSRWPSSNRPESSRPRALIAVARPGRRDGDIMAEVRSRHERSKGKSAAATTLSCTSGTGALMRLSAGPGAARGLHPCTRVLQSPSRDPGETRWRDALAPGAGWRLPKARDLIPIHGGDADVGPLADRQRGAATRRLAEDDDRPGPATLLSAGRAKAKTARSSAGPKGRDSFACNSRGLTARAAESPPPPPPPGWMGRWSAARQPGVCGRGRPGQAAAVVARRGSIPQRVFEAWGAPFAGGPARWWCGARGGSRPPMVMFGREGDPRPGRNTQPAGLFTSESFHSGISFLPVSPWPNWRSAAEVPVRRRAKIDSGGVVSPAVRCARQNRGSAANKQNFATNSGGRRRRASSPPMRKASTFLSRY